ncbi:MAG TPA: hypothetical protein VKB38_08130 [Terracidiphilus sp.]|nr:hypothetical protein [Terracidiphilus sp.]
MRFLRSQLVTLILIVIAAGVLAFRIYHRVVGRGASSISDLSVTDPLNQPGADPAPAEAYGVYSALYEKPEGEPLAFAGYTSTDIPQVGGSCLSPSTPDEHEMADAFVAANRKSHRWEQKFDIPQGYQLLSAVQTSQALACLAAPHRDAGPCQPWQNLRHVRFLGNPGFDSTHSHAVVSIIRKCGRYCGAGGLFVVEKDGGTWRRSDPTPFVENCSWMFQR